MVSDHYRDRWGSPDWNPGGWLPRPDWAVGPTPDMETGPTQTEFNKLKREVEEMKELLKRAVKYDKETGQPHCEQDEKIALLKKIAEMVGVSLDDVLNTK